MRNTGKNWPNDEILLQNFLRGWECVGREIQFQTYSVFGKRLGILHCIGIIEFSKYSENDKMTFDVRLYFLALNSWIIDEETADNCKLK